MSRQRQLVLLVLVGALVWAWSHGTFDRALVNVGLNAQDCATNGFGATFCGDALDEYRREVVEPLRDATDPDATPATAPADYAPCDPDGVYAEMC